MAPRILKHDTRYACIFSYTLLRFTDGRCWLLEPKCPGVDGVTGINVSVLATTRTLVLQVVAGHHTAGHAI
jgi:hypothetical protein